MPVPCPLHESRGWRYDLDELASKITPKTRAIYVNSPGNPTGGVLTRDDVRAIAALAERHGIWVISDEAYEDIVYDGEHVSAASLPGMYERTISFYTFSKTYAMTGLRLGYVAAKDATLRERMKKALFYTASNVASVVQFGGIGALEGSQAAVAEFRDELKARRDLFYQGIREHAGDVFAGEPPKGSFYAFLRIDPDWRPPSGRLGESLSWTMTEYLIAEGRIGCVPGADFGANGEGYSDSASRATARNSPARSRSMGARYVREAVGSGRLREPPLQGAEVNRRGAADDLHQVGETPRPTESRADDPLEGRPMVMFTMTADCFGPGRACSRA